MKVLVTGVTGRIGRNLASALIQGGASVHGVVLPDDQLIETARVNGVECIVGDLRDPDTCRRAVENIDVIFHLGAKLLFGPEDNAALMDDNLRTTFNMLDAASTVSDLQRFVFASSDEVYPSLFAKYEPIDENHPREPYSFYGVTKLTGEEMLLHYHRARGLPGTIARFALTIEPWEVLRPDRPLGNFLHLRSMAEIVRSRAGDDAADRLLAQIEGKDEPLIIARDEDGAPYVFQYCDVRDLVHGLLLLMSRNVAIGEAFNLSGPGPFAYDRAVPYLAERTDQSVLDARIPGPPIRIHHSTAKARAMLGYRPEHDIFSTIDAALTRRTNS